MSVINYFFFCSFFPLVSHDSHLTNLVDECIGNDVDFRRYVGYVGYLCGICGVIRIEDLVVGERESTRQRSRSEVKKYLTVSETLFLFQPQPQPLPTVHLPHFLPIKSILTHDTPSCSLN